MNGIQIFNNPQFGEIRVVEHNQQPMFCLADVCKVLGLTSPHKVAERIDEEDRNQIPTLTSGGKQQITFVTESGLYDVIIRSDAPSAKPFRKWVTSEVLPTIRKTGGYIAAKEDDTPEMIMARAVLVANQTIENQKQQLEQAKKQVATLAPKAALMDKVMDSDQKIDIGQAAKILQLPFGRNTLFNKLREKGVFFKNRNEPKQEYVERGYFELKEKWIDRDNHDGFMVVKVLVTQRGLDFIARLFEVIPAQKSLMRLT